MLNISGHPLFCPVRSFRKYLSKLHPSRDDLWQRPLDSFDDSNDIWYMNSPVGKNVLADMMRTISRQSGLSREYTNHSIRATSITVLDTKKFSDRDIMSVSGHKSEASIKSYTGKVTTNRRYEISSALGDSLIDQYSDIQVVSTEIRLSQERIEHVEGELNLSQEQIDELLVPMEQETDDNLPYIAVPNVTPLSNVEQSKAATCTSTISVDIPKEPTSNQVLQPLDLPAVLPCVDNVVKPIENMPFTPMISNCVVTFNVNLNAK